MEVTKIKCENNIVYNSNTKDLTKTIEQVSGTKTPVIELVIEGLDGDKKPCVVCRTKYISK